MGIRAPRRIFRKHPTAPSSRGLGRAAAVGLLMTVGVGAVVLIGQSTSLFGRATQPPSQVSAKPADIAVIDGETLRVGDRVLHLRGIQAPARGEACGAQADCGSAAAAELAAAVRNRTVTCKLGRHSVGGQPSGACTAGDVDLSASMVASGWAHAESADLRAPETRARQAGLGMWAGR